MLRDRLIQGLSLRVWRGLAWGVLAVGRSSRNFGHISDTAKTDQVARGHRAQDP
jgi:hypothetical protein